MPKVGWKPTEETREKWRQAKLANPTRYWLGKKRGPISDAQRAKTSAALKGRPKPEGWGERIGSQLRGIPRPAETTAKMTAAMRTPEMRAHLRATKIGSLNPCYGKPAHWPKHRFHYGGVAFRSSWEVRVAKAFDAIGIRWCYESRRFDLGTQTYCPDFYLPDLEFYVEVKGFFGIKAQTTASLWFERYPNIPLAILRSAQIDELEAIATART